MLCLEVRVRELQSRFHMSCYTTVQDTVPCQPLSAVPGHIRYCADSLLINGVIGATGKRKKVTRMLLSIPAQ